MLTLNTNCMTDLTFILKMTTQVIEISVLTNNIPSQDYTNLYDQPTLEIYYTETLQERPRRPANKLNEWDDRDRLDKHKSCLDDRKRSIQQRYYGNQSRVIVTITYVETLLGRSRHLANDSYRALDRQGLFHGNCERLVNYFMGKPLTNDRDPNYPRMHWVFKLDPGISIDDYAFSLFQPCQNHYHPNSSKRFKRRSRLVVCPHQLRTNRPG